MVLHPASAVPWAHSSLRPAVLPASPVGEVFPPNTWEPLPSRTAKPEVRTGQLAFFPELNFPFEKHGSLMKLPSSPVQRCPVWYPSGREVRSQLHPPLQEVRGAWELPRCVLPQPPGPLQTGLTGLSWGGGQVLCNKFLAPSFQPSPIPAPFPAAPLSYRSYLSPEPH